MADRPATTSRKKKPGRKRRVAGLALLVIGVLIVCVWRVSWWWGFGYQVSSWGIGANNGLVGGFAAQGTSYWSDIGWYFRSGSGVWDWFVPSEDYGVRRTHLGLAVYDQYELPQPRNPYDPKVVGSWRVVSIVPWPFALASLLGGGWLVWSGRRARRRAMVGLCLKCGYDLSGLGAAGVCPECGEERGAPVTTVAR
ncbi:MAG: hypothetical protein ACREJO_12025 [Phycisphaerales bacterium]